MLRLFSRLVAIPSATPAAALRNRSRIWSGPEGPVVTRGTTVRPCAREAELPSSPLGGPPTLLPLRLRLRPCLDGRNTTVVRRHYLILPVGRASTSSHLVMPTSWAEERRDRVWPRATIALGLDLRKAARGGYGIQPREHLVRLGASVAVVRHLMMFADVVVLRRVEAHLDDHPIEQLAPRCRRTHALRVPRRARRLPEAEASPPPGRRGRTRCSSARMHRTIRTRRVRPGGRAVDADDDRRTGGRERPRDWNALEAGPP